MVGLNGLHGEIFEEKQILLILSEKIRKLRNKKGNVVKIP